MKLAMVLSEAQRHVAVVGSSGLRLVPRDIAVDIGELIQDADAMARLRTWSEGVSGAVVDAAQVRFEPPLAPRQIVCIGNNYATHVAEGGMEIAPEPIMFTKLTSSVIGHGAAIRLDPTLSDSVDFEAELALVIGRTTRHVTPAESLEYVAGYTCANDVSARDVQRADGQWVRAKSFDTFCPLGPWFVTADEIPDPEDLRIECWLSGERMQTASTGDMIHGVRALVSVLSRWFTLQPGDIILTGTPAGVGAFREPPRFLRSGDRVEVTIEGIGTLSNPVGDWVTASDRPADPIAALPA